MWHMPGGFEWVIIVGLALLIFGPKQIPRLGKALGDSIRTFRQAGRELTGDTDGDRDETHN